MHPVRFTLTLLLAAGTVQPLTPSTVFAQIADGWSATSSDVRQQRERTLAGQTATLADPCRDTVLEGLLIGAGAGLAPGLLVNARACGGDDAECSAIVHRAITLPGAAIGAAVGALMDGLHKGDCRGRRPQLTPGSAPSGQASGSFTALQPRSGAWHRWSLVGDVARSAIYDDEGSLGRGPAISGALGYAWSRHSRLELTVRGASHTRDVVGLRWESTPTVVTARAVREFGSARVRPFLAGGLGVMHVSGTTEYRRWEGPLAGPPVTERIEDWRSTALAFDLGAGVTVLAGDRWFVQPEFRLISSKPDRDTFAPEPPYSMMHVGVGIGYRF
jgi:hypothetical protein